MPELEDQIVMAAIELLREIQVEYPKTSVANKARRLQDCLSAILDDRQLQSWTEKALFDFGKAAGNAKPKRSPRPPKFITPVFKCLDDCELCIQRYENPKLCWALTALCVGRHLIPFVGSA